MAKEQGGCVTLYPNSTPSSTEGARGEKDTWYVRDILKIDAGGRLIVIIHCYCLER